MGLGAVLVLAALSLFLFNQKTDRQAGQSAAEILPQMVAQIQADAQQPTRPVRPARPEQMPTQPTYPDPFDTTMTEVEIEGYAYIGYLSIPSLDLELPVMSQWDQERLKIAPCRYTGSTKTDDLIICAHNYDHHFWPIRSLSPGDEVYFTDMDGKVWQYAVDTVEILAPTDVSEMTASDYELTLFTCTYGGGSRITVRCNRNQ